PTGVDTVDRLTIVSHDKFQEIVDYANSPESIIRGGLKIVGIPTEKARLVIAQPAILSLIGEPSEQPAGGASVTADQPALAFESPREQEAAKATLEIIRREYERLPRSSDLAKPEIQKEIVEKVRAAMIPAQGELDGVVQKVDVAQVVAKTIKLRNDLSIDIPRITIQPVGDVSRGYKNFKLDLSSVRLQPVDNEILIQELHRRGQHRLMSGDGVVPEQKPEDYLVRGLIDFNDISYDEHSELLYKLAGQAVAHLRSYLKDQGEVVNVLQYHQQTLARLIHTQMQDHYEEKAAAYEAHVSRGFTTLRPNPYSTAADEACRDFRAPVVEKQDIRKMVFGGFKKCLYDVQKFDSDPERRFAVVLESDKDVLKWLRPAKGDLHIHHSGDSSYEPDFVVEAKAAKLICEVKSAAELEDAEVLAKARAATDWCRHAGAHAKAHGGKPWSYLLIPHDRITDNKTLAALIAAYTVEGAGDGPKKVAGIKPP
ncbi:MAG: type III restriction endonuclease subunit R, partial [Elusimicrobiota bacterium]